MFLVESKEMRKKHGVEGLIELKSRRPTITDSILRYM